MHTSVLFVGAFAALSLAGVERYTDNSCQYRARGFAPGTWPDDPDHFARNPVYAVSTQCSPVINIYVQSLLSYKNISKMAESPHHYERQFVNKDGAVSPTAETRFLGTKGMESYNTQACADFCDTTAGCHGFNTYIARNPIMNPGKDCPDSNSTADYVCTIWSTSCTNRQIQNMGQMQENFQVVIAGSNGE